MKIVTNLSFLRPIGASINKIQEIMRENNQLIVITHLSQLAGYLIGFGSLIIPLILWATNKNDVYQMDAQGKKIVNFQISMLIYAIISIPLIFLFI